jgi:hypothetical protein
VEVSAATGIPLECIRRLDWEELATYVEVLTPPKTRRM